VEYMSASLPVLSCITGYSRQYLEKYGMGLGYREGDSASFAQAIEAMAADEPARARMAESAHARFLADFEADLVNGQQIAYFGEVIRAR